MAPIPPIVLDTTLHDLYCLDNDTGAHQTLIYCPLYVHNRGASTAVKFLYHSVLQKGQASTPNALVVLRLRAGPQRHGFSVGKMPVVILTLDSQNTVSKDMADIKTSFAQIQHHQQPIVSFMTKLDYIALGPGTLVALDRPTDCLTHLPHLLDLETHYEILLKRGLALSRLPTPPSMVIDSLFRPNDVHDLAKLSLEAVRMTMPLDTYKIPFVVKLPQSSGKGTFIVSCDADRWRIKETIKFQLHEMLARIDATNEHLNPCSLVLQEYIAGSVVAISLFVTQKGRPIFVACCRQTFNHDIEWVGGSIIYADQDALHQKFTRSLEKVALFLHQKGYYGPVGVDIITDMLGEQHIIDLNVRTPGTFCLGLMAGHFQQRGLGRAILEMAYFLCSRKKFEEDFLGEIHHGRLVITAWTHDEKIRVSYGVFIIGGSDAVETKNLLKRVQEYYYLV